MIKHDLEPYGIGSGQHFYLFLLDRSPGITQNEVSRGTDIDKATAAKGLAKLEQQGYIERIADDEDRRIRRLYLTEKGKAIIPRVTEGLMKITEVCSAELTGEELEQLFALLDKVEHSLSGYIETRMSSE